MAESEFRAYPYITQVLNELGWNTKHPKRGGDVYTQGEFYRHDPILADSLERHAPENTVLVPWDGVPRYWLIEAKATHNKLRDAISEARFYADEINKSYFDKKDGVGLARFVTGIAGTPDESFYVSTEFWNGAEWAQVAINDYDTTGFLSYEQCADILQFNSAEIATFDDRPERFLAKANAINRTLQDNEIPVGERAHIIAALLLALARDGHLRVHLEPRRLIREINGLIADLMEAHGKEQFADVIQLRLPATEKNHRLYRAAILSTLQHLREMNIRSAINADDDALGKFYETFLKYANGAKEMGIVLTPRHITRFAVDVIGVGPSDVVLDPACGTGGFLIAAMESMRKSSSSGYKKFRLKNLYGIELRDDVYALALVNMIFRGDGKSHVEDGDCFDHQYWKRDNKIWYETNSIKPQGATRPFSRVLMNPPFKLARSESDFVDHALRQMKDEGILFAVLPHVVVGGTTYKEWRERLLKRHSLLACVKFDKNLFYPVAEATYGIIVRAHVPMKKTKSVFMGILMDDNHRPRQSKMLSKFETKDNVDRLTNALRRFLLDQHVKPSIDREQRVVKRFLDSDLEFSPESYIRSGKSEINAAFRAVETNSARWRVRAVNTGKYSGKGENAHFKVSDIIECELNPKLSTLKNLDKGTTPVVSATAKDNGIAAWHEVPKELCHNRCITVSLLHNTKPCQAFWHPYRFGALIGKVMVLRPTRDFLNLPFAIMYLCEAITVNNDWRYHYARSVKLSELIVELPVRRDGDLDLETMANTVRSQLGLEKRS